MKTPLALLVVLALTGCGGLTPSVEPTSPCVRPVAIPDRALTDVDVEVFWGRDRNELLKCGDKVETLSGRTPQ